MKNALFLSTLFAFLLFSCHKQEVVPLQSGNSPTFKAIITSDNETLSFDVADGNSTVFPSSNKEHNVYRVKNIFQSGQNQLVFSINDGNPTSSQSFLAKIQGQDNLKFSFFNASLYAFNIDTLRNILGGEGTQLYVDDNLLTTGSYTFPSAGIYTFKAVKTIEGKMFTISNDLYVGFVNPYGYLNFNYDETSQKLSARIINTTLPFSVSWFLDNTPVGNLNELTTQISPENSAKKLSAIVNFNGKTINYEGLIDLTTSSEKIIDIKKYSLLFANPNNAEDLRIVFSLTENNQTWKVNESNTGVFTIQSVNFHKEINGNKTYQLIGSASNLKIENTLTGETKAVDLKINAGIYLPY